MKNLLPIAALVVVIGLMSRKKKLKNMGTGLTELINKYRAARVSESYSNAGRQHHMAEVEEALYRIAFDYGEDVASTVEKMLRWETAHFTSAGFLRTRAAGMEAVSKTYPYGWSIPAAVWSSNPDYKPTGLTRMIDSGNRDVWFITFSHVYHAAVVMAEYVKKYRAGRWYSTNSSLQSSYEQHLKGVKNRIIV